nr:MAG TPA: hypothetical protein [Caudoviricetes sp.]
MRPSGRCLHGSGARGYRVSWTAPLRSYNTRSINTTVRRRQFYL